MNQSEIFRFIWKPWDDGHLLLTLQSAIDQYWLLEENARLSDLITQRNAELERPTASWTAKSSSARRRSPAPRRSGAPASTPWATRSPSSARTGRWCAVTARSRARPGSSCKSSPGCAAAARQRASARLPCPRVQAEQAPTCARASAPSSRRRTAIAPGSSARSRFADERRWWSCGRTSRRSARSPAALPRREDVGGRAARGRGRARDQQPARRHPRLRPAHGAGRALARTSRPPPHPGRGDARQADRGVLLRFSRRPRERSGAPWTSPSCAEDGALPDPAADQGHAGRDGADLAPGTAVANGEPDPADCREPARERVQASGRRAASRSAPGTVLRPRAARGGRRRPRGRAEAREPHLRAVLHHQAARARAPASGCRSATASPKSTAAASARAGAGGGASSSSSSRPPQPAST